MLNNVLYSVCPVVVELPGECLSVSLRRHKDFRSLQIQFDRAEWMSGDETVAYLNRSHKMVVNGLFDYILLRSSHPICFSLICHSSL